MPDQRPIVELARFLDLPQGNRRFDSAAESEVGHRQFGVFRVRSPIAHNICNTHDGCITHAVVDENAIPGPHIPNGAQRLGISYAVPHGLPVALKLFQGIRFGVGLGEKIMF